MNLLIVKTSMGLGGIERSLIEFLRHLNYSKYQVDLLLLYGPFDLCPEIPREVNMINAEKCGKSIRFLPAYILYYFLQKLCCCLHLPAASENWKNKKNSVYYKALYSRFCRKCYDAVIAYQQSFACEYTAKYVLANRKIMMYHHGAVCDQEYLEPWFRMADCVIAVSKGMDQALAQAFPFLKGKTSVLENYEDADYVREKGEAYVPAGMVHNVLNLCTCGRLSPEKGFELAIETAALLQQKNINFHWYFVGDGYDRKYTTFIQNKISALNLLENITITGFLTNPYPYLKHCSILVIPSLFEANPMIVKEAVFMRCAVVTTKTGGAMDMLQDGTNALFCENTPESAAEKIMMLAESPTMQQQIKNNLPDLETVKQREEFYRQWDEIIKGT